MIDFNVDGLRLLMRYDTARKALEMWERERQTARDELLKIMGAESEATYAGRNVLTVSRTRPRRFDSTAFSADHPHLYERYRKEATDDEVRLVLAKNLPPVPNWYPEEKRNG